MTRKSIRLGGTSYAVLTLLELLGPSTPYDLKQALERSIENFWPVPHTSFYAEPEGVLKIFAGGDPVPIFKERCEWHRSKLAELEGYLNALVEDPLRAHDPRWDGVRASLLVGVSYNRMLLEAMEGFLEGQGATDSS
jgi:hypothetical protein